MKQITLDYETYKQELNYAYNKAHTDQGNLLPRGVDLMNNLMSGVFYSTNDKHKIFQWIDEATKALQQAGLQDE